MNLQPRLTAFFFFFLCCCSLAWSQPALDVAPIETKDHFTIHPVITRAGTATVLPPGWTNSRSANGQVYLLSFVLHNTGPLPKDLILVLGNNTTQYLELLERQHTGWASLGKTGNALPIFKRPHQSFLFYYRITIPARQNKAYQLVCNSISRPSYLPIFAFSNEAFNRYQNRLFILFGIFEGCILLTALFNLFLFFSIRDRIHLLYFFYAVINCLLLLGWENMDMQLLYPNIPFFSRINKITYACISLCLCVEIMKAFLNQKKENSRFYNFNRMNQWLLVLFIIPNIFVREYVTVLWMQQARLYVFELIAVSTILGVLLSCVEKLRQGYRIAAFYLAAVSTFLLSGLLAILLLLFQGRPETLPPNQLEVGIVLETIIISFGLLYRYNIFKKENEQLTLALQTEKVKSAELMIATQESEQKRIAQDLHDELGGNLAALKINLQALPPGVVTERLVALVDKTAEATRHIAHNLMPPEWEGTSLEEMLRGFFLKLNGDGETRIQFFVSGTIHPFCKQNALILYRIVMELTNNIIKHAAATEATLQLLYFEQSLEIVAEDNGRGFSTISGSGIGLKNIHSRVHYLGGTLHIDSSEHGTTIVVQIPYQS